MAKRFYTPGEAAEVIGCNLDDLRGLVAADELREFRDGDQFHYKVEEVKRLALVDQTTGIPELGQEPVIRDLFDPGQDDTSLGAELLDEIYSADDELASDLSGTSAGDFSGISGGQEDVRKAYDYVNRASDSDRVYRWMLIAVACSIISILSMIVVVTR